MQKVEFFFVGVGKSGTSWLFSFFKNYSSLLSVPVIKEPYLIDLDETERVTLIKNIYSSYDRMADFSTTYYWDEENPQKIKSYNPNAKIIITVRKPSDRIKSHFNFLQRSGMYTGMSMSKYIESGDPESIVQRSNYWDMITRYETMFGKENLLVLPLEQLRDNPNKYVERICIFLNHSIIVPNDKDIKPVLKQSKARSVFLAKIAKSVASVLREKGYLQVLGRLKNSKIAYKLLYKEKTDTVEKTESNDVYMELILGMDKVYSDKIGAYID